MTKYNKGIISILFLFLLTLFAVILIFGPMSLIWSINQVFPMLAIPYNFWTWLAVSVLTTYHLVVANFKF